MKAWLISHAKKLTEKSQENQKTFIKTTKWIKMVCYLCLFLCSSLHYCITCYSVYFYFLLCSFSVCAALHNTAACSRSQTCNFHFPSQWSWPAAWAHRSVIWARMIVKSLHTGVIPSFAKNLDAWTRGCSAPTWFTKKKKKKKACVHTNRK